MDDFSAVIEWIQRLERDAADLRAGVENMFRVGPVVDRDKDKGVRLQTDADQDTGADEPHKSNWGNPAERSGFERHVPAKGTQCMFLAPFGDQGQGVVIPYGHNEANPNPASDVDEVVIANHGKIKLSISKDGKQLIFVNDKVTEVWEGAKKTLTVDGNTTTFEKDTITFPDGSKVRHGDRNIGKDHVHGGVQTGSGKTGDPDA